MSNLVEEAIDYDFSYSGAPLALKPQELSQKGRDSHVMHSLRIGTKHIPEEMLKQSRKAYGRLKAFCRGLSVKGTNFVCLSVSTLALLIMNPPRPPDKLLKNKNIVSRRNQQDQSLKTYERKFFF